MQFSGRCGDGLIPLLQLLPPLPNISSSSLPPPHLRSYSSLFDLYFSSCLPSSTLSQQFTTFHGFLLPAVIYPVLSSPSLPPLGFTMYNVFTVHCIELALYTVHCIELTLYTVQSSHCTLYRDHTLQCTKYTVSGVQ